MERLSRDTITRGRTIAAIAAPIPVHGEGAEHVVRQQGHGNEHGYGWQHLALLMFRRVRGDVVNALEGLDELDGPAGLERRAPGGAGGGLPEPGS
jgi:hypothetical protein